MFEKFRQLHIDEPGRNWYNSLWRRLQAYHDLPGPTGLSPHRILFLRDRVSRTLPWLNHGKVARDAHAIMAEVDDTAAKVCKALQDEHDKRAKYFKQGKVQRYALQDTVWVERHHKDVLSRHRQAFWYVPGVIFRKVGQDVYAVLVGDNKILDLDHTQLRPRAPDPMKVLPWVVDGAGGLGAGKTSGAGTRGVDLNVVIGGRTGDSNTHGGKSSNN